MKKRRRISSAAQFPWRSLAALTRQAVNSGSRTLSRVLKPTTSRSGVFRPVSKRRLPPTGAGDWIQGLATGAGGARHFRLYRPPQMKFGERLPLLVMLHGCGQDAKSFAESTRMNRLALHERFLVLYPEQHHLANSRGCWNWFDTASGRAYSEAALILAAIDQACLLYGADASCIAIAGLSAGASMATLLATQHPARFKAVAMHSGIPPGMAHSSLSALSAMRGQRKLAPPSMTAAAPATNWPPLLVIHGKADAVVVPENGHVAAQIWAHAAAARASATRSVKRGQRYPMRVTDYKRSGKTLVTLIEIDELAHHWSGGAAQRPYSDVRGPDASRMIWRFAAKQFRE